MELVVIYEIEDLTDGTKRIGNAIEVAREEAIMLVQAGKAKAPESPIGVLPTEWLGVVEAKTVVEDAG